MKIVVKQKSSPAVVQPPVPPPSVPPPSVPPPSVPSSPILAPSQLMAENWHLVKPIDLTRTLLKTNLEVYGTKFEMVNRLRTELYGLPPLKNSTIAVSTKHASKVVYDFIWQSYFKLAGNTHKRLTTQNEDDIATMGSIKSLPPSFTYCVLSNDGSNCWYGFDIRTLHTLVKEKDPQNPFTREPIATTEVVKIKAKYQLLEHFLGGSLEGDRLEGVELTAEKRLHLRVLDVATQLKAFDFDIKTGWLTELSLEDSKLLYGNLNEIWSYRLELTSTQRAKIVRNGTIFTELPDIKRATNREYIIKKLLRCLVRLISEGETTEERKLGATYFMIGLTSVVAEAAVAFPFLYEIWIE